MLKNGDTTHILYLAKQVTFLSGFFVFAEGHRVERIGLMKWRPYRGLSYKEGYSIESMKQRFKRKHLWKLPNEIHFDDDTTEFGRNGKTVRRMIAYKPHSHTGGRKPNWRSIRKSSRNLNPKHRGVTVK